MDNRAKRVERFSQMFSESRNIIGKSQEYMAAELGVSRKTIQNWETGVSSPSFFQVTEWFRALGINPMFYFYQFLNYETMHNLNSQDEDQKIVDALNTIIEDLPIEQKRELIFFLLGSHGSNPSSVLHLITAYLHLPLLHRVAISSSILECYEMSDVREELIEVQHIHPNVLELRQAIKNGKQAVIERNNSYIL